MKLTGLKLVETLDINLELEDALQIHNAINEARGKFPFAGTFPFKGKYHIGYEQGLTLLKALLDNDIVTKEKVRLVLEKVTVERNGYENVAWKLTPEFEEVLKETIGSEANDIPAEGDTLANLEHEIFG